MEETGTNLTVFIFTCNRVFRGLTLRGFSRTFKRLKKCFQRPDDDAQHRIGRSVKVPDTCCSVIRRNGTQPTAHCIDQ